MSKQLPDEVLNRIKDDANCCIQEMFEKGAFVSQHDFLIIVKYLTAEATRSLILVEGLEKIRYLIYPPASHLDTEIAEIINEALTAYNKTKEDE